MITIKQLIEKLGKYPDDALAYAYDGEVTGIVIVSAEKDEHGYHNEIGFIQAVEAAQEANSSAEARR